MDRGYRFDNKFVLTDGKVAMELTPAQLALIAGRPVFVDTVGWQELSVSSHPDRRTETLHGVTAIIDNLNGQDVVVGFEVVDENGALSALYPTDDATTNRFHELYRQWSSDPTPVMPNTQSGVEL